MITAIQLEKNVIEPIFLSIIICNFSSWQEHSLIILIKIDENRKINFYDNVLLLYLTINLKIKSS